MDTDELLARQLQVVFRREIPASANNAHCRLFLIVMMIRNVLIDVLGF